MSSQFTEENQTITNSEDNSSKESKIDSNILTNNFTLKVNNHKLVKHFSPSISVNEKQLFEAQVPIQKNKAVKKTSENIKTTAQTNLINERNFEMNMCFEFTEEEIKEAFDTLDIYKNNFITS